MIATALAVVIFLTFIIYSTFLDRICAATNGKRLQRFQLFGCVIVRSNDGMTGNFLFEKRAGMTVYRHMYSLPPLNPNSVAIKAYHINPFHHLLQASIFFQFCFAIRNEYVERQAHEQSREIRCRRSTQKLSRPRIAAGTGIFRQRGREPGFEACCRFVRITSHIHIPPPLPPADLLRRAHGVFGLRSDTRTGL